MLSPRVRRRRARECECGPQLPGAIAPGRFSCRCPAGRTLPSPSSGQPVEGEVLLVGAITVAISAVATLFPSLQASALRPVDGLRYD
jgi:hypothetical protein